MGASFMPVLKSRKDLDTIQSEGLKWTVEHAFANSAFYRERFRQAGVAPHQVRTLDDLRRLPCLTAQDLQNDYPFPLRSVPLNQSAESIHPRALRESGKSFPIHERTLTTGRTCLRDAMKWPGFPRRTGCKLLSDTASGLQESAFSWDASDSERWPFRWDQLIRKCTARCWWTCRVRCFARPHPWPC